MTSVFTIGYTTEAQLFLYLDNVLDGAVLDGFKICLAGLAFVNGILSLQESVWAKERAQLLSSERRSVLLWCSHFCGIWFQGNGMRWMLRGRNCRVEEVVRTHLPVPFYSLVHGHY